MEHLGIIVMCLLAAGLCALILGVALKQVGRRSTGEQSTGRKSSAPSPTPVGNLRGATTLYGWYDPMYASRIGASVYETDSGKKVVVTHVSSNPSEFSNRNMPKDMKFYGRVKNCVGRHRTGDLYVSEGFDILDIAMLYLIYTTMFNDFYPYDETIGEVHWVSEAPAEEVGDYTPVDPEVAIGNAEEVAKDPEWYIDTNKAASEPYGVEEAAADLPEDPPAPEPPTVEDVSEEITVDMSDTVDSPARQSSRFADGFAEEARQDFSSGIDSSYDSGGGDSYDSGGCD